MRLLLIVSFFFTFKTIYGQYGNYVPSQQKFPFDLWHDGKLVLDTGDTLRGNIKYDLQDLLQVRHANRLESFSARKVLFFEIFDQYYKRYRQFYSLPYSSTGGYKTPVFF